MKYNEARFVYNIIKEIASTISNFEMPCRIIAIKGIRIVDAGVLYFGLTYQEGKKIKFYDAIQTLHCIF